MIQGKGICAACHGRGTIYHTHLIRFGTDDPCEKCGGTGFVMVTCDSVESAAALTNEFELRRKHLSNKSNEGFPVAVAGAIATRL